jgi:hypothetical protein
MQFLIYLKEMLFSKKNENFKSMKITVESSNYLCGHEPQIIKASNSLKSIDYNIQTSIFNFKKIFFYSKVFHLKIHEN